MSRIRERNLFVFGPRILNQEIAGLEIDGLIFIEHSPHPL
jgi:hypothetical protein